MPLHPRDYLSNGERPFLLVALGVIGLLGCVSLFAGAVIAPFFVPGHDWVADTISDLAAGQSEIVMDIALYGFAAGLLAAALGAAHAHLGRSRWTLGLFALAVLSVVVVVIGARNEYGDNDSEGIVIHAYLVYGLGALFLAMPLLMADGMGRSGHRIARIALYALAALWAVTAPVFFFLPTSMDGLYERGLGIIAAGMVATLSTVFLLRGLR